MRPRRKSNLLYYLAAAVIILAAAGLVVWKYYPQTFSSVYSVIASAAKQSRGNATSQTPRNDTGEPVTYASTDEHFSLIYPSDFVATNYPIEGIGKRVVFEKKGGGAGFEVTVIPFSEPGPITPERIAADQPDMLIDNPRQVVIASSAKQSQGEIAASQTPRNDSQMPALAFNSTDEYIGNTYEVWFVQNGLLYEVTTYANYETELNQILQQWKFQ
jgi:hypothetical protein